jgi:hypothetical protein
MVNLFIYVSHMFARQAAAYAQPTRRSEVSVVGAVAARLEGVPGVQDCPTRLRTIAKRQVSCHIDAVLVSYVCIIQFTHHMLYG